MISIIIPAYNETENLGRNLPVLEKYMENSDYELIIVNDGSEDNTEEVAKSFLGKNTRKRRIKIISYPKNMGRGYAVRKGMKNSKYKNIIMMDADMPSSINLKIIKDILNGLKHNDIVIASRFMHSSKIKRKKHRSLLSFIYRKLVKIAFPNLNVSDTDSGLKAFRKDTADYISKNTRLNRWSWDLEVIALARKKGCRIKEIPLDWEEKGKTTLNLFMDPIEQFIGVLKIRLNYGKN